ncbi:MAG: signal peptidase II [Spirochaetota bacterium]|nr:signal peptidase II [Spirochaetota bacterium]
MKKHIYAAIIFIVSLTLDIVTKYIVVKHIALHERIDILGSFIQLILLYNKGGLFGILQGYQSFFLILSIIVLAFLILIYIYEKNKTSLFCASIALIISGAVGNIIDRISGRPGVVDFIYIGNDRIFRWPAFNIADAVIVIGAFLLIIIYYKEEKKRRIQMNNNQ